ncbi:hypothetical protein NPIL_121851 [Nephila pilipes]|uniref:C2H2-type domain-containing protein n=1 Tax=Nephila pilipes TaxID=299642 RepID=A0A8X6IHD7_NEPPI|nr:hypothetical protein NPIL_121851 [Nephila pilipes]
MDERIPWDSTIYSPGPSTSGGIAQELGSHCFARDKGKEITKSNTHNLGGNEKQQKETHHFKTPDYVSFISENIQGVEKVTGDKKCDFKCKTCGKQYKYLRGLKRHEVVVHTGERRYPCDYCDKACKDSFALKEHVRIHTKEKPFSCLQCPKRFRSSSNLNQHKLVHLQERPYYPCPDCERIFTRKRRMNFHRKNSCKKSDLSK